MSSLLQKSIHTEFNIVSSFLLQSCLSSCLLSILFTPSLFSYLIQAGPSPSLSIIAFSVNSVLVKHSSFTCSHVSSFHPHTLHIFLSLLSQYRSPFYSLQHLNLAEHLNFITFISRYFGFLSIIYFR